MIYIRQPFFSITAAILFGALGLMFGISTITNVQISFGGTTINDSTLWAFVGVMFLMSYFSLVHLKN